MRRYSSGRRRARLFVLAVLLLAVAVAGVAAEVAHGHTSHHEHAVSVASASPSPRTIATPRASTRLATRPTTQLTTRPTVAFPSVAAIAKGLDWAEDRDADVGVALVNSQGKLYGYNDRQQFQSASLAKAMLLVAYLRRYPEPTAAMRVTLTTMIEDSDNDSADAIYAVVGNRGLLGVAHVADMEDFTTGTSWINTEMTAADQAHFFFTYEQYLPAQSVSFARTLLSHITAIQRWGIPAAAGPAGWQVFFKGGWLGEDNYAMNQAAWLERDGVRWSLAILTAYNPTSSYGWQTLKGITGLLLGCQPTPAYLAIIHQYDTGPDE